MQRNHIICILKKSWLIMSTLTLLVGLGVTVHAATPLVTDVSISDAVENELILDSAVPAHRIVVSTVDGIVTLSGSVDNILAKERAARIAMIVRGVRAVVNEIKVDPPILRTDYQIREDVQDALLSDPAADSYEIGVTVDEGVVSLSGTVESWQEKDLCEKVVKNVKGVREVDSNILVSFPLKRSDEEIEAEIEQALKWDAFVDHALIKVNVQDGHVTLSGTAGSAAEKNRASLKAYVQGVKSVNATELTVKRWARDEDLRGKKYVRKSEQEIEKAVKDALRYDPRLFSFTVTPEVDDDGTTVILRGTVNNLKAKRAAAQDARHTVGVLKVDNRIRVSPTEQLSDPTIEHKVKRALLRDPFVENYQISVDVRNGEANLYGTVDTFFEKTQAEDVASRVKGVIVVDNNLDVQEDHTPFIYDPYVDERPLQDHEWYDRRPRFPAKSDWQIKDDIQDELWWSPFVDSDDVKVMVDDGKVTLSGVVSSWSEYNAAANNAYEGGAVYVDNDLTVK